MSGKKSLNEIDSVEEEEEIEMLQEHFMFASAERDEIGWQFSRIKSNRIWNRKWNCNCLRIHKT